MTGRNKPSGLQDTVPSKPPAPSGDAEAQGDNFTRIGGGAVEDGTVFEPGPSQPSRPSDGRTEGPVRRDSLLGAFDGISYDTANPLLAAATPLLMLLSDLCLVPFDLALQPLRQHLADAIRGFQRKTADSGIAEDDACIARYVLCAAADDIVGNLPGVNRSPWLQDGMLTRFFNAQTAGTGFYEALNAVLADPEPHCDLLEVMHACLCLGFEGQYRAKADGREARDRIRRDVYETLRHFRPRASPDISPQWEGLGATLPQRRRHVPLWVVAAAVPTIVAGAFFAMRSVVADRADAVVEQLANLNPHDPAIIRHTAFVPQAQPPPATTTPAPTAQADAQLQRLRKELTAQIEDGTLTVATKGDFVVIEIGNELLFSPGAVQVKPAFDTISPNLVAALDKEPGPVTVVGYTDSQRPGASSVFKSNHDLSVARAKAIKNILIRTIGDPSRLQIEGKGEQDPIADNATAEGRARNRRVDILIRREQAL